MEGGTAARGTKSTSVRCADERDCSTEARVVLSLWGVGPCCDRLSVQERALLVMSVRKWATWKRRACPNGKNAKRLDTGRLYAPLKIHISWTGGNEEWMQWIHVLNRQKEEPLKITLEVNGQGWNWRWIQEPLYQWKPTSQFGYSATTPEGEFHGLRAFGGEKIKVLGTTSVTVKTQGQMHPKRLELYVVAGRCLNLLGLDWLRHIPLD